MHTGYWTDGLAHLIAHTFCVSPSLCLQTLSVCLHLSVSLILSVFFHAIKVSTLHLVDTVFLNLYLI